MKTTSWIAALAAAGVICASAQEPGDSGRSDEALLRRYVIESGEAFNKRDLDGMLARVSPDLVLTYPGTPDMSYAELAEAYAEMIALPPGMKVSTAPTIEDIFVSGDLGVVRVTWTTTRSRENSAQKTTRMRDMQVWQRGSDGQWRFTRGMHYLDSATTSGDAADTSRKSESKTR